MRKLKQALSLSLALILSLALAAPAVFELEQCFDYTDYEFKDNKITFSDVVSQKMVKQMEYGEPGQQDVPLVTVKVGTTITTEFEISKEILEAYITNDGYYDYSLEETSKSFPVVGLSYTLNEECIGLWGYISTNGSGLAFFYLNVIADDGSAPSTPTQPEQPTDPGITVENIPASGTAKASTQTVTVDGKKVEFQMYALLDANGNGTNYVKLRDMAHVLNGTKAQFSVGYSNETGISATSGQPYQDTGSEMNTPFSGDRAYTGGGQSIQINGKAVTMTAISLLDDNGGGYTYFKLRDLGAALGFNVGYSNEQGVYIESDKPYIG